MSDTIELYEYKLTSTNDEEIDTSRKYFFQLKTAKEHNEQYILNDVPRRLIRVRGGEVIEKPEWWSGTQEHLREISKSNHKFYPFKQKLKIKAEK